MSNNKRRSAPSWLSWPDTKSAKRTHTSFMPRKHKEGCDRLQASVHATGQRRSCKRVLDFMRCPRYTACRHEQTTCAVAVSGIAEVGQRRSSPTRDSRPVATALRGCGTGPWNALGIAGDG